MTRNWNGTPYNCEMRRLLLGNRTLSDESQQCEVGKQKRSDWVLTKIFKDEPKEVRSHRTVFRELRRMGMKPLHVISKPLFRMTRERTAFGSRTSSGPCVLLNRKVSHTFYPNSHTGSTNAHIYFRRLSSQAFYSFCGIQNKKLFRNLLCRACNMSAPGMSMCTGVLPPL